MRVRAGEELLTPILAPSFHSNHITIGCWAAITYGRRTSLVRLRQRTPDEGTSKRDRLGLNAQQYADEINEPFLIPYLLSLDVPLKQLQISEDNATPHEGAPNRALTAAYGTRRLYLPANSPDLNLIENVWHLLKGRLRKRFTLVEDRPHTEEQLWTAMEEEWEAIDQITIDSLLDSMPNRVTAVISANSEHTKW